MPDYLRPPVVQAYLEIRPTREIPASSIEKIKRRADKLYPLSQRMFTFSDLQVDLSSSGKLSLLNDTYTPSYRFESSDARDILHIQKNALWVGCLSPYQGWDALFSRFQSMIEIYQDIVNVPIARIGCRYHNRIDIPTSDPSDGVDIGQYLNFGIQTIPIGIEGFHTNILASCEDDYKVNLQVYTAQPVVPNTAAVVVDLDIYKDKETNPNLKSFLEEVGSIRKKKNDLFEGLITNKSRAIFNTELNRVL